MTPDTRPAPVGELIERLRKWEAEMLRSARELTRFGNDPSLLEAAEGTMAVAQVLGEAATALAASVLQPVLGEVVEEQGVTGIAFGPGSRASTEPVPVSVVPASIPNADNVLLTHAGPSGDGGFEFAFRDGEEGGVLHIIAAHLAEMMMLDSEKPLNCVQLIVQPAGHPQLTLTMQRAGGKTPLMLKAEASKLLHQALDAIDTGRSEPLFIMRDAIRNWLEADPASAIEARSGETGPGSTEGESATGKAGDAQPDQVGGIGREIFPATPSFRDKEPKT